MAIFSRPDNMRFCTSQTVPKPLQAGYKPIRTRIPLHLRLLPALGAVALCGLLVSCGSKTEAPPQSEIPATNAAPSAAAVSPELAKLVGRWERPDGDYVLEIKSVDASGKADVGYFNPDPIHVSRAVAWQDAGTTRTVIELQDVNYPGCTYTLEYNPQKDELFGQYYQAALQEKFEVVFSRLK